MNKNNNNDNLINDIDNKLSKMGITEKDFNIENNGLSFKESLQKKEEEYKERIREKYLNIDKDTFSDIANILNLTFLPCILEEAKNFFRYEYKSKDSYIFVAFGEHLLKIIERTAEEGISYEMIIDMNKQLYNSYIKKFIEITKNWNITSIKNNQEFYYGLAISDDSMKEPKLYVSNSMQIENSSKFFELIYELKKECFKKFKENNFQK